MNFAIRLAGVSIGVASLMDEVYELCRDYLVEEPPAFTVVTTPADIEFERRKSYQEALAEHRVPEDFPDSYLETLAVYRKIAVRLLDYDTWVFHGSVVAVDGRAYLFAAVSGTGKTTHTELWLRHVPGSFVVNGDKPLLKVGPRGVVACGTPWAGKEGANRNCVVPLAAICLLERGEENHIEPVSFTEAYPMLLQQSYRPKEPEPLLKTMGLVRRAGESLRLYRLRCNMEPEAALVACEGMGCVRDFPRDRASGCR